jgi:hypothetical protein
MNRYVFTTHTPDAADAARGLVAKHQPGDGVRAALPVEDEHGEFTHFYAVQGISPEVVDVHMAALHRSDVPPLGLSAPSEPVYKAMSFDTCAGFQPCEELTRQFGRGPASLPPLKFYVFLLLGLVDGREGPLVLPEVRSLMAGVAGNRGQSLLVQLASDSADDIEHDLGAWVLHEDVADVRIFRGSGHRLVRNSLR